MSQVTHTSNGPAESFPERIDLDSASREVTTVLGEAPATALMIWESARIALDPAKQLSIEFAPRALRRIGRAADLLARLVAAEEPVYGVNTGFGHFADVVIPTEKLVELQYNIIRSHCCGVGEPLPRDLVAAMWLISLSTICRGNSGVSVATVKNIADMIGAGILARVPSRGSVGASGDLAPSAHAVQATIGEGMCTMPWAGGFVELPAAEALERAGIEPLRLGPKEGLSLINGTALTTALAIKAWYEGCELLRVANVAAAMSIEAMGGSRKICSPQTTRAHRHRGTIHCGQEVARWLDGDSELSSLHSDTHWIQDPYSLRCVPQVHGAIWEELRTSEQVLNREINAAADNPLLFPKDMEAISCGNFHAIYPARVSDRLASALTTLASISERRISQAMCVKRGHLPTFLVENGGINSGFMMAHVTAAALVSEAKSLSFPASVDSIPTNLLQEDHVSMGPIAGQKANQIADNLRRVLAIELLAAAQAIDLMIPQKPSRKLAEVHARIREFVPTLKKDRALSDDIELLAQKIRQGEIIPG